MSAISKRLVLFDYDRTIGRVKEFMLRFLAAAASCDISSEAIIQAQERIEAERRSFNPFSYIHWVAPTKLEDVIRRFVEDPGPPLLYSDTLPLLEKLENQGIEHMVLTYSEHKRGQRAKLIASGYGGPVIVLDHTRKGLQIARWQNSDGTFTIPCREGCERHAGEVILIDDKPESFDGMPTINFQGILIQRPDLNSSISPDKLPAGLAIIRSLDELQVSPDGIKV